jgi:pimeloyl-ACP methyl ester carboxylesterase
MKTIISFMIAGAASSLAAAQPASAQQVTASATASTGQAVVPAVIPGLDGDWDGTLDVGGIKLRLILHITSAPGTGTTATLDSIDQGAKGIPVAAVTKSGDKLQFDIKVIAGSFEAALSSDGRTLAGTWRQGPNTIPLTLTRRAAGAAAPTVNRPQTPVRPFPYREEEVSYGNPASPDKITLAGTLTTPQGKGPFPAAILIAGSGPNGRDEDILGHKLFLVLSDYLTRQGIAILRVDKRGVGHSTGSYDKATSLDFASDVKAGLAWLRTRSDIDQRHIGLIGHSEGGLIAPMVAADDPGVAFVVLMAGPGENGTKILLQQGALILKASGMSESAVAANTAGRAAMFKLAREEKDPVKRNAELHRMMAALDKTGSMTPQAIDAQLKTFSNDWFRFFLSYEPAPTLARLRMPVLAINGSLDLQVPPEENLAAIRTALASDKQATIIELPSLNHLFQTAKTGAPSEYSTIEETMAPLALKTMSDWIIARTGVAGQLRDGK